MPNRKNHDPRQCALLAAKAADEMKATDIMVQHVGALMTATDYFVIATAQNNRQVDAIIEKVEEKVRKEGNAKPFHSEGLDEGTWALLDYGDFIVHVFQPEARDYYRLESLWNDAPIIDLKEAGITDVEYSDRIAKLMGFEKETADPE
jgi:ribosome-associated protein